MGDFSHPSLTRKARKCHLCTYCGEVINKDETYTYQTGVYEDNWYESKLHHECFDDLNESGEDSYIPYDNERPK